ncbi:hypothetical protein MMYC01_204277 [Madurella mycetomatis]|uniref:Uncharacterized protein n=1 Tax=Madurella mycetomatis TaxID=100816 RepID=A0A175W3X6_9PEZI|nr:hypothetical protein MMYC01_204277 [Madurella mycetomatis]
MKFSLATVLAFAAAVLAQPRFLNSEYTIEENVPITLRWGDAVGPVTITLMTGPEDNLRPVMDITTGETGNSFTWTPADIPSGTYALRITDSTEDPNYSPQFVYSGTGEFPTSTSSGSVTSTSATASSTETSTGTSTETETETSTETTTGTSTTEESSSTTTVSSSKFWPSDS